MYSLDVNFLKDRYLEDKSKTAPKKAKESATVSLDERLPYIWGGVALVLFPLLALLSLWMVNSQIAQMEQASNSLDGDLQDLQSQSAERTKLTQEVKRTQQQTQSLVTVFNYIKPWSAILNDIQSRTIPGVQIVSIEDDGTEGQQVQNLSIQGYAKTYDNVNDFLLALQGSRLLTAEKTVIEQAELIDLPVEWEGIDNSSESGVEVVFPKVVSYTIATELNQIPASELLAELRSQGAIGLVARIRNLQQKGVIGQ